LRRKRGGGSIALVAQAVSQSHCLQQGHGRLYDCDGLSWERGTVVKEWRMSTVGPLSPLLCHVSHPRNTTTNSTSACCWAVFHNVLPTRIRLRVESSCLVSPRSSAEDLQSLSHLIDRRVSECTGLVGVVYTSRPKARLLERQCME